ncbi:MAG: saccharopine dehydrogenase C-terminal domain-containing protein [Ginsengibacter sp.]
MKSILIFGAGKSATSLIEYLCTVCDNYHWDLCVCDANLQLAKSKIAGSKKATAVSIDVSDDEERISLIQKADLVISMLPPHLHFLVAQDCVTYLKHLLTASYIDEKIKSLEEKIRQKGLIFICELGLDPGIDHMSAMKIIDDIRNDGGKIISFKSHCGGLIAPESDDNPWHYKITWNPANVVMAGSSGALYLEDDKKVQLEYPDVFDTCTDIDVPGLFPLEGYPNRDSISYIEKYGLHDAKTFLRTTLRYPSFCSGWDKIVNMGFTDTADEEQVKSRKTYSDWYQEKAKLFVSGNTKPRFESDLLNEKFIAQIDYLGIRSDESIVPSHTSSAAILQYLLETKLAMYSHDKDMIVMVHEIGYLKDGKNKNVVSSMIVKGNDQVHTAMAKTVGLPLGIAAKLIMLGKIKTPGLHIPVSVEIYEPVLAELEEHNIKFNEEITAK